MNEFYEKWQQYQYYVIIGIVSLVALFFLPMVGSEVGLAFQLPNTTAGWIVYVTSKLLVAGLNVLIFHCFVLQAKVNIKDNSNYVEAVKLLQELEVGKILNPRSPQQYFKEVYGKKGVRIFVTTVLAAIGLTQAVLTFNWVSMLSYLFTVLMGLIFGVLQMNQTEIFWTEEFYQYAKKTTKDMELAKKEVLEQINDTSDNTGGADLLESANSDCSPSIDNQPEVLDSI